MEPTDAGPVRRQSAVRFSPLPRSGCPDVVARTRSESGCRVSCVACEHCSRSPLADLLACVIKRDELIDIQHSSRRRPLKDSICPFAVGFPGCLPLPFIANLQVEAGGSISGSTFTDTVGGAWVTGTHASDTVTLSVGSSSDRIHFAAKGCRLN